MLNLQNLSDDRVFRLFKKYQKQLCKIKSINNYYDYACDTLPFGIGGEYEELKKKVSILKQELHKRKYNRGEKYARGPKVSSKAERRPSPTKAVLRNKRSKASYG